MYIENPEEFIVHYDMDSFFASVELLDKPHLKDKIVVVGSNNMIATSNYVARKLKIKSGMPFYVAEHICNELGKK